MRKGYQKILTFFEKEFPSEFSISGVRSQIKGVTDQDLLSLQLAGFLEVNPSSRDNVGDHHYKISKEGFSHLVGLRTYQMAKRTKILTNWIIGLTIVMIILSFLQILKA